MAGTLAPALRYMALMMVTNMLDVIGMVDEWQRRAEVYILCDPLGQNSRISSEALELAGKLEGVAS